MSSKLFEDLLKIVIRSFYDEAAIVVLDYILYHGKSEEHRMSEEINLPFKRVRQALLDMGEHQILVSQEGKKDRRHEERSGNMFTRGPDIGRMVYWAFNPDIKNVICSRVIELKESLEKLVDDAKQVLYKCEKCQRNFTIEEALPHFMCNFCQGFRLVQKEVNVTEAQELRDRGLAQIRHLEKLMRECLDVSLPSSFFGIVHDGMDEARPTHRNQNYRPPRPANGSTRGYAVTINLPEAEEERRDATEELKDVDKDLLKYYHRYERRLKRKKGSEINENMPRIVINGTAMDITDVTPYMQMEMAPEEHLEFSKTMIHNLKFL